MITVFVRTKSPTSVDNTRRRERGKNGGDDEKNIKRKTNKQRRESENQKYN